VNDKPPYQTLSSEIAWSCPWFRVRRDELLFPDGRPGVYNVVEHPGAVWVVPVTTAGEIVLIHNYRYAVDDWCWELPAGGLKPEHTPLVAAQEELREEVGGQASEWQEVNWFYTTNGVSNEKGYVFLATGVTLGEPDPEVAEVMSIHTLPAAQALNMARSGEITDAPSALALLLVEPFLNGVQRQI